LPFLLIFLPAQSRRDERNEETQNKEARGVETHHALRSMLPARPAD
jgi:hypothetical protein